MPVLVQNAHLAAVFLAEWHESQKVHRCREEVWDGVTVILPYLDLDHQEISGFFSAIFMNWFVLNKACHVNLSPNISDREKGWMKNYRNPDTAYYSDQCAAKNCGTHWCGGPDFLLEVVSPDDLCREKLPFYAAVGTREVLILDREPWKLELYQLRRGKLWLAGESRPGEKALASGVVPLTFALRKGKPRPTVHIGHTGTGKTWSI